MGTNKRELRASFGQTTRQEVDGGVLYAGVKLLAAGTWTDSATRTPLVYPPTILERDAANWVDHTIWSRHGGGVPRDITESVGDVRNPRYENEAVVGDLFLHTRTDRSRDTVELIDYAMERDPIFVSVEHGGGEEWDPVNERYISTSLIFGGLAVVNKGACKVCAIENEENNSIHSGSDSMTEEQAKQLADAEALVKKQADEIAELKKLSDAAAEAKTRELAEAEKTAHDKALAASEERITALEATLKKLADAPAPQGAGGTGTHELEEPSVVVVVDKGEVSARR